jgi:hypothetical protein
MGRPERISFGNAEKFEDNRSYMLPSALMSAELVHHSSDCMVLGQKKKHLLARIPRHGEVESTPLA